MVADPYVPVPPIAYGGAERIIDILAEGLAERGWLVTLACHFESTCKVRILPHPSPRIDKRGRVINAWNLLKHLAANPYDLIHSSAHQDLTALLWPLSQKVIQTFHAPPDWKSFSKRLRLIPKKNLWFTTVGYHMVDKLATIAPTRAIHNGVRIEEFTFQEKVQPDAPLVFLGRIEEIKGTHLAIEIAKATGRRLVIAGNRAVSTKGDQYFREQVEPHLSAKITYIGPVNDVQKNQLLGQAAAFLMPILWDEPFGIVMAEALACGTPVIGFSRGALPEIVTHSVTGACCTSIEEIIDATLNLDKFSRHACRESAVTRFSSDRIVEQYIDFYEEILSSIR